MDSKYNHLEKEKQIYKYWEDLDAFSPEGAEKLRKKYGVKSTGKSFSVPVPPPNANAPLHFGHATYSIEDLLIRYYRMKGYDSVGFFGTDHAGFETQVVVERNLKKEGKSRFDFDRETFYKMVFDFVKQNSELAKNQFKLLGMSFDWERSTFMLDDRVIETVYNTFIKMEKDGLVYRDGYMVNYSVFHGTTFSELETEYVDSVTPLYYILYKIDGSEDSVTVATVRPETIYADVAIAVNPKDKRYKKLIGKNAINPLNGRLLPIITDNYVDKEFGTGALKITPGHDVNDFEIGKKNNLPVISLINLDGKLNSNAPDVEGLRVFSAREKTIEILENKKSIVKVDKGYKNRILVDYKDGKPIEPMVLPNWFIKVEGLAKEVKKSVLNNEVTFNRDVWKKDIIRWMENIKPWPISRQTVFGIRIPAYYSIKENPNLLVTFIDRSGNTQSGVVSQMLKKYKLEEINKGLQKVIAPSGSKYIVSKTLPKGDYLQETDTFDTWFSSGQWPLLVTNYPNGEDFKKYYPHSVLDSGWEIIFFWIARMIMFGKYLTGEVPFKEVYFHNIITASDGKKMSKSRGNVVNPIGLVESYSADAVRFFLLGGVNSGAKYSSYNESEIKGYRNFGNKLWNITRFFEMQLSDNIDIEKIKSQVRPNSDEDEEVLEKLSKLTNNVTKYLDNRKFHYAGEEIYNFIWNDFANDYLEKIKNREDKEACLSVFYKVLTDSLKLLHPFMPFVTEAIWKEIKTENEPPLIISPWPS